MTTAKPTPSLGRTVLGPLSLTALVGLMAVLAAALVSDRPAVLGALVGAAMVGIVFGFGSLTVTVVARVAPAASLLVALLTYTLQVVLVALVYLRLSGSGALGSTVDARWLSGTLIGCTLAWTLSQIVLAIRAREPLYDLDGHGTEASVR